MYIMILLRYIGMCVYPVLTHIKLTYIDNEINNRCARVRIVYKKTASSVHQYVCTLQLYHACVQYPCMTVLFAWPSMCINTCVTSVCEYIRAKLSYNLTRAVRELNASLSV